MITEQAAAEIRLLWESLAPETKAEMVPCFVWIEYSTDPNFTPHLTLGTLEKAEALRDSEYFCFSHGIGIYYYLHDDIINAHADCVIDFNQKDFIFRPRDNTGRTAEA